MLTLRRIPLDTYGENTAFMLRRCIGYNAEQFQALRKIRVTAPSAEILATLVLVDSESILGSGQIGLCEQAFQRLGVPEGTDVAIAQAKPLASLEFVRRKIGGDGLKANELEAIIGDIANHQYGPLEIAAFLVACAASMSDHETFMLTRAMVDAGDRLTWRSEVVVDKHCIGGVPGNRTSMIVVPIVAAHGMVCPKTSSRAITSPSGTADTMEVLANVDLTGPEMSAIVAKENAVLAWGGRVRLSPADDVLISVERPLRLDTRELIVASILSKKVAAGSTNVVVDIPVGATAKVRSRTKAVQMRELFDYVARRMGIAIKVVFTDGSQPIGAGVGPVLEARDVMQVLRNETAAPSDLREHALQLAGQMLAFDPALKRGAEQSRAYELLASGAALAAMERLIAAQGRQHHVFAPGLLVSEVKAERSGRIATIDCAQIARIATLAGAPMDKGAGIDLLHKVGARVSDGEPLYRIHSSTDAGLAFAGEQADESAGYEIG